MKPSCHKSIKDYENNLLSLRFHTNRLIYNIILKLFSCEKTEFDILLSINYFLVVCMDCLWLKPFSRNFRLSHLDVLFEQ